MRTTTLALALLAGLALGGCRIKKDPSYDAAAATCAPVASACSEHSDCCSYACVYGACIANSTQGGICRTSDDCNFTLTCVSGRCMPGYACEPNVGDTCASNNDCCSGNCLGESATYPVVAGHCGTESPPTVVLGGPFTVPYYATTVLHAAASDPDPEDVLYYAWDVLSAPTGATAIGWTATGTGAAGATPSIFLSAKGTYTIRVRVADGPPSQRNRATVSNTMTVVAINLAPVVDADPTHLATTALRNTPIQLVGAVSDPNGTATPVSCAWYAKPPGQPEISTPIQSWASCPVSPGTIYTTPIAGPQGVWEFRLEASDGELTTSAVRRVAVVNAASVAQACAYECVVPPAGGVPSFRVGNLGAAGQPAPSIPLHGSATDANGDVGTSGFTWEWRLDSAPAGSSLAAGLLLGSSADAGVHAPPFDGALDPDVAGTYVVRLHVDDGWSATADSTVPVYVEPYLRPLHPLDGSSGLPRGSVAGAAYVHATTAANDRIVYVGHDDASGFDRLWIVDPESSTSANANLSETPRCLGLSPDGSTALVGGDLSGSPRWERVTLSGPSPSGANLFDTTTYPTPWTGLPNDIVSAGGREYAVSDTGVVHELQSSGLGSSSTAATCDSSCSNATIVGSHAVGTTNNLWLLSTAGDLRWFEVRPNGNLSHSSSNYAATGQTTSSDLWLSTPHNTSQQEVALSAGPMFPAMNLSTSSGSLPYAARFLDTATPAGSSGAVIGLMVNADGTSIVKLDGAYADAGALRVPRVGYLGTGYPLEAVWAFVRSDGSARYAVLRKSVGGAVRWYLMRY